MCGLIVLLINLPGRGGLSVNRGQGVTPTPHDRAGASFSQFVRGRESGMGAGVQGGRGAPAAWPGVSGGRVCRGAVHRWVWRRAGRCCGTGPPHRPRSWLLHSWGLRIILAASELGAFGRAVAPSSPPPPQPNSILGHRLLAAVPGSSIKDLKKVIELPPPTPAPMVQSWSFPDFRVVVGWWGAWIRLAPCP